MMKPFRHLLLLSLLWAGAATAAHATEYTLLIYETQAELAKRTDQTEVGKAYWASWMEYSQAVKSAGIMRGGAALTTDQDPNAGEGERLGGYFIIDVADRDAATAWASKAPISAGGGHVEVRSAYPTPAMR